MVPPHRCACSVVVMLALTMLLAGCGAPAKHASADTTFTETAHDNPASTLLARYGNSPALAATAEAHETAQSVRGRATVFMSTWFPGGDVRLGAWSTIDATGKVTIYQFVHDVGFQNSRSTSVVNAQLPELESMLVTLPPSQPPDSLAKLLIVSFRQGGPGGLWLTRLYDRTNPPADVKRIFREMTGAPIADDDPR